MVAREEDLLAGRVEERSPVGFAKIRDLAKVRTVDVAHVDLHVRRCYESLRQELLVLGNGTVGLGTRGTEDQLGAVGRKECAAVVAKARRYLTLVRTVDVHRPQLEITRAHRRVHDQVALG